MLILDLDLSALSGPYTSEPVLGLGGFYAAFTRCQYAQVGGTSCAVSIETSVDEGLTWIDMVRYVMASTGDYAAARFGSTSIDAPVLYAPLADNTVRSFFAGDRIRAVITPAGVFTAGARLIVDYFPQYRGRNGLYL